MCVTRAHTDGHGHTHMLRHILLQTDLQTTRYRQTHKRGRKDTSVELRNTVAQHNVLQCGAVCCIVLQCVAVCCSELQYVADTSAELCNTDTALHSPNTLPQHIHTHTYTYTYAHAMCLHPVHSGSIQTQLSSPSKTTSQSHGHTVITPNTQQTTTQPRRNIPTHNAEGEKRRHDKNTQKQPHTPNKTRQSQRETVPHTQKTATQPHSHTKTAPQTE